MAVIFKKILGPTSSSNKQGNEKDDVVYWYSVPSVEEVNVIAPFIDKISIVVPVTDPDRQGMIRETLYDVSNDSDEPSFGSSPHKQGYKIAVNYTDPSSDEKVLIQADPNKLTIKNFLRLEFNPVRIGPAGLSAFKAKIAEMTLQALTWNHIIAAGKVTRIDIATDLVNAPMEELLYRSHEEGKAHVYVGEDGDLETVYLGIKKPGKSSNQMLYNKTQQQKDLGQSPGYGGMVSARVEMIHRSPHQKLSEIKAIKNPFNRVTVMHPLSCPDGFDQTTWALFLDSCQLRGVDKALKRLPDDLLQLACAEFDEAAERTWRPSKLWTLWPRAVKKSKLLSSD